MILPQWAVGLGGLHAEFLIKGVRIWAIRWEELYPRCLFKFSTQEEGIVFCFDDRIGLPQVSGCETP